MSARGPWELMRADGLINASKSCNSQWLSDFAWISKLTDSMHRIILPIPCSDARGLIKRATNVNDCWLLFTQTRWPCEARKGSVCAIWRYYYKIPLRRTETARERDNPRGLTQILVWAWKMRVVCGTNYTTLHIALLWHERTLELWHSDGLSVDVAFAFTCIFIYI